MAKETILDQKLLQDITDFCKLNEIGDTTTFINKLLRDAYMEFKWMDNSPKPPSQVIPKEEKKEEIKTEEPNKVSEPKRFFGDSKNRDLYGE